MDYLVPTARRDPAVEIHHLETPSAFSETGAKGMGEGGTMGAPACVATAVSDALAHLGVRDRPHADHAAEPAHARGARRRAGAGMSDRT